MPMFDDPFETSHSVHDNQKQHFISSFGLSDNQHLPPLEKQPAAQQKSNVDVHLKVIMPFIEAQDESFQNFTDLFHEMVASEAFKFSCDATDIQINTQRIEFKVKLSINTTIAQLLNAIETKVHTVSILSDLPPLLFKKSFARSIQA